MLVTAKKKERQEASTMPVAIVPVQRTFVKKMSITERAWNLVLNMTGVDMPHELIFAVFLKIAIFKRAHVPVLRHPKPFKKRFQGLETFFRPFALKERKRIFVGEERAGRKGEKEPPPT